MPFYFKKITVPANTSAAAPQENKLQVMGGVLHRVICVIPAGHAGLAGLAVFQGLTMIAPVGGSDFFQGDDSEFDYAEYIEIPPASSVLTLKSYNTDTAFEHSFLLGIGILPSDQVPIQTVNRSLFESIKNFFLFRKDV